MQFDKLKPVDQLVLGKYVADQLYARVKEAQKELESWKKKQERNCDAGCLAIPKRIKKSTAVRPGCTAQITGPVGFLSCRFSGGERRACF